MTVATREEPAPEGNDTAPIWPLVVLDARAAFKSGVTLDALVDDMADRDRLGRERYGVPLQAGNGRRPLVDAYQEALDLCVYLRQAMAEGERVEPLYDAALLLAFRLRARMGAS